MTSRLRDFVRMNPLIFLGSKVGEDPKEFIVEVYKIVHYGSNILGRKESRLHINLKDVAQVFFTQ